MSAFLVYSVTAVLLAGLGIHGLITRRHLLRQIMALNVIAGGGFLLLISTAYRNQGHDSGAFADPVPQAMVLTGIVVAISATAFALALVRRIYHDPEQAKGPERAREIGHGDDQKGKTPEKRTDSTS